MTGGGSGRRIADASSQEAARDRIERFPAGTRRYRERVMRHIEKTLDIDEIGHGFVLVFQSREG